MHMFLACAATLDWDRLLKRFGAHWRVLLSYLCLFGFVYPSERTRIPRWVMTALLERLEEEIHSPAPSERICQGTLISREQYLPDLAQWGFEDARLTMTHAMTEAEIADWTRAICGQKRVDVTSYAGRSPAAPRTGTPSSRSSPNPHPSTSGA